MYITYGMFSKDNFFIFASPQDHTISCPLILAVSSSSEDKLMHRPQAEHPELNSLPIADSPTILQLCEPILISKWNMFYHKSPVIAALVAENMLSPVRFSFSLALLSYLWRELFINFICW